jgi:hypothetical protein
MAFVARWGKSAKTAERSDWVCNRSLNKVGLVKEKDICSSGTVIVIPPASGPSSLSSVQLAPAAGPGNLTATLLPPAAGPSGLSASSNPPASGPGNLSATLLAPAAGPSSMAASLQPPAAGPSGLSALPPTVNFATDNAIAPAAEADIAALTGYDVGTYALNSDGNAFYVYDGTNWLIFEPYN